MRTGLYEKHLALGAKMVDFAGWEMPIQYKGIIHEHLAVREKVGIFDVSHMGRVLVKGPEAEKLLDYLSTNKIVGKKDLTATYTVWCKESGGAIDDLIVYKQAHDSFFVVFNASNRLNDLQHLQQIGAEYDVKIQDCFEGGILAVQGPKATPVILGMFKEAQNIKPMRFLPVNFHGEEIILAGTGYTGAGGFEFYASMPAIVQLWDQILDQGQEYGIEPVGLGARDTLRLEMGFALYGHELSEEIAPTESVSRWTVKWDKGDFLGRTALENLEHNPHKRSQCGIVLKERGIAREGCPVFKDGKPIGEVTSGTMSPSLKKAIAIILVEGKLQEGENIEVKIRDKHCLAEVVKLPFYKC